MSFFDRSNYRPDREPNAHALVFALRDAWERADWERLASLCSADVVLEGPTVGRLVGHDAVVALFREGRRFPGMTGTQHRRTVGGEDAAVQVYDVFIAHEQRVTVTEVIGMREGRVGHWLTLEQVWP